MMFFGVELLIGTPMSIKENWNQDHPERYRNFNGLYVISGEVEGKVRVIGHALPPGYGKW